MENFVVSENDLLNEAPGKPVGSVRPEPSHAVRPEPYCPVRPEPVEGTNGTRSRDEYPFLARPLDGLRTGPAHHRRSRTNAPRQTGAVLVVALIFLLLLSILAVSIMRSGQLEVLMAGNSQAQLGAFEFAEGIAESILARWGTNLNPNEVICSTGFAPASTEPGFACTVTTLAWDDRLKPSTSTIAAIQSATVNGRARPLNSGKPSCVPAFITGIAHGTWAFFFDVEAGYDNSAARQGASRVNHGAVLVNPVSTDCFANPPIGNLDKFANLPTS